MTFVCGVLILFLGIFPMASSATVYTPGHTKVLFTEIDGWVSGQINDISYKKIGRDEKVYTVLSLNLNEFSGISRSQITNFNNFKILFPGGIWQGVNVRYSGSPEFRLGDKGVFLLKKRAGGFFIHGLSAGVIVGDSSSVLHELHEYSIKKFGQINQVSGSIVNNNLAKLKVRQVASNNSYDSKPSQASIAQMSDVIFLVIVISFLMFIFIFVGKSEKFKK